ncbi:hypothetical protein PRIPAC_97588 [Pristionchus pacificus]|uniref:G protein-coupled receptor n=1 Tax=Pristionchus pacificus TaxID=54126 RepID=A0A2A6D1C5_PRIPA|nr:hypothetical protein PRIPAC_97588 [Pristionchus pacificus]|eukprot:PDM84244.1 G protein-coupled receptor [Pristionchus pacificus]
MLLPLLNVIGSFLWFLDFADILHSNVAQRSIFIWCSLFALGSPLINMFFIPPYRRYIKSIFGQSSIVPLP